MNGASRVGPGGSAATQAATPAGEASNASVTALAGAPSSAVSAPTAARATPNRENSARSAGTTRASTSGTPTRLRHLGALGLLAGVLTGASAFAATNTAGVASADARGAAAAAGRLQQARIAVQAAAADAGATVLARETPATTGGAYERTTADLQRASADLTAAAALRGTDGPDLSPTASALHAYGAQVSRAATGRDAAVLTRADATATQAGEDIRGASDENSAAIGSAATRVTAGRVAAGVVGLASVAGLLGASWWLARKTHRVVNPPLALGTLLVAGVTLTALATSGAAATQVSRASEEAGSARGMVETRSAVVDARAAEIDALVPGTSTTLDASAWAQTKERVNQHLLTGDSATAAAWKAYRDSRDRTASLAGTDRAAAVTEATTVGQPAFARLDDALIAAAPTRSTTATTPSISPAAAILPWALLLGGVLGGVGAVLAAAGRLKEYR